MVTSTMVGSVSVAEELIPRLKKLALMFRDEFEYSRELVIFEAMILGKFHWLRPARKT